MTGHGFNEAVEVLFRKNAGTVRGAATREETPELMREYVQACGLEEELTRLPVVRIAGTKGKGSTAAFTESVLRSHGLNTGLFTSPHLVSPCERLQINGRPVSQEAFASHFWALEKALASHQGPPPTFFNYLTLMALRCFREGRVDVAVMECGVGARYDSTAVFSGLVNAVTAIDYDHTHVLGSTLPAIAREKAFVFSPSRPALASPQSPDVTAALSHVASLRGALPLETVALHPLLRSASSSSSSSSPLGIAGPHQLLNASLALRVCQHLIPMLPSCPKPFTPSLALAALSSTRWPGRTQLLLWRHPFSSSLTPQICFFLDGAHTPKSMAVCLQWYQNHQFQTLFQTETETETEKLERIPQILLFGCNAQYRSAEELFRPCATLPWDAVLLCGLSPSDAERCAALLPSSCPPPLCLPSVPAALPWLSSNSLGPNIHVLATGSLHLVGDLFRTLRVDPYAPLPNPTEGQTK